MGLLSPTPGCRANPNGVAALQSSRGLMICERKGCLFFFLCLPLHFSARVCVSVCVVRKDRQRSYDDKQRVCKCTHVRFNMDVR